MPEETLEPSISPGPHALAGLAGEWKMILSNAAFLDDPSTTVESRASFEWIKGGAYLLMTQGDEAGPQFAYWMIGGDESEEEYTVLYFDARGVSRVYKMSFGDGVWSMWRQAPGFHQRFNGELSQDSHTITGRWEHSEDGKTWQHDFDITYRKK